MAKDLKDIFKKVGRPLKYKTPEDLEDRINDYFNDHIVTRLDEDGNEQTYLQGVTISGLSRYLGFSDRSSIYDYKDRPKFFHTIKKDYLLSFRTLKKVH